MFMAGKDRARSVVAISGMGIARDQCEDKVAGIDVQRHEGTQL